VAFAIQLNVHRLNSSLTVKKIIFNKNKALQDLEMLLALPFSSIAQFRARGLKAEELLPLPEKSFRSYPYIG